jgi:hypothetical protein
MDFLSTEVVINIEATDVSHRRVFERSGAIGGGDGAALIDRQIKLAFWNPKDIRVAVVFGGEMSN